MKKLLSKILIVTSLILLVNTYSIATSTAQSMKQAEITDEYKEYLELPDEEKEKIKVIPIKYSIESKQEEVTNPISKIALLKANSESSFSLRNYIPENTVVRAQGNTNYCWAFASLSSLETNLALNNYYNNKTAKAYDFSERHMIYSTIRNFKNGQVNKWGLNRALTSGGNYYNSIPYLTNGMGAINEEDMPYDESQNQIDISEILNKTVQTEVYDVRVFPTNVETASANRKDLMDEVKSFIKLHGSVEAGIFGATIQSDYYNDVTGAIYCDNKTQCKIDHDVAIIGWNDNYEISNFNSKHRPSSKGAWIVKNSWGEKYEYTFDEIRNLLFTERRAELASMGINSASEITNEVITSVLTPLGFTISGDKVTKNIGDNGLMYVSYEDVNILSQMAGIEKATEGKDYSNIYQYNETGWNYKLTVYNDAVYIGNKFTKASTKDEYLTKVSLNTPDKCTCKVYVNVNGSSMKKTDLQQVRLANGNGESETIDVGYHTLEFAEPIKINSNDFAVVIKIDGESSSTTSIMGECKNPGLPNEEVYSGITTENSKCFCTNPEGYETSSWTDLSKIKSENANIENFDTTLKAFTTTTKTEKTLERIAITKEPSKKSYSEGENFDKSGMEVTAYYTDGTSRVVNDYSISNANNLKSSQTSVTIKYENKTAQQSIQVSENNGEKPSNTKNDPENSNFSNITCKVGDITKDKMTIEISNFEQNKNNDNMEYYYYISKSPNDKNTGEFVKINNPTISGNTIKFDINASDIKGIGDLESSETVYLYVREMAISGGNQSIFTTNAIQLNIKQTTTQDEHISDKKANAVSIKDDTVAKDPIPQTGVKPMYLALTAIIIIGTIVFVRYKVVDHNIKGK